ncbi:hypothetical protein Tco_0505010 [Tanacetum coccineum]
MAMTDYGTEQVSQAPTAGLESAIVVKIINAQTLNSNHSSPLINLVSNRIFRGGPPQSNSSSSFEFQQMAAALEDKMTLKPLSTELNEITNTDEALVPTPVPIKAVEERCTTCGNNHSFNVCPMTREDQKIMVTDWNDVYANPSRNMQRTWVERCEAQRQKAKELRDRETHISLQQNLIENIWHEVEHEDEDEDF